MERPIDRQTLYNGKKLRLELHTHERPDGTEHKREVVVHPGAVVVLPVLDEKRVVLIRNQRVTVQQVLLELPAGTLEPGEVPINCAGRELLEETGYLAKRMSPLASFYTSPGILTEKMHAFVATDLVLQKQALEADEQIEVEVVELTEALRMIREARIIDGKSIACLLMYAAFHRQMLKMD